MLLLPCRTLEKEQQRCSADCNVFFVLARCPQYFPMLCCLSLWQASAAAAAALAARTKKKRTAKAWVPKIQAEALHQHRCIPGFHFFLKHIHRIVRARWLGKCTLDADASALQTDFGRGCWQGVDFATLLHDHS